MIEFVGRINERATVVTVLVVATAVMFMMSSCRQRPLSQADYVHLPDAGWLRNAPLTFTPHYADSSETYSLSMSVRHTNAYPFRNLALVVDIIDVDSIVTRRFVDMRLADEYGNWKGGGFGTLYQDTVMIAPIVAPDDACTIVIWQAMQGCDTLTGLTDVGLFVRPL